MFLSMFVYKSSMDSQTTGPIEIKLTEIRFDKALNKNVKSSFYLNHIFASFYVSIYVCI